MLQNLETESSQDEAETVESVPESAASLTVEPADFGSEVLPLRGELLALAMRYSRNKSDAEDLVQETMAKSFIAWKRFKPGTNCRAWLFRILTNSFINGYRKKKRHRRFAEESIADAKQVLHRDTSLAGNGHLNFLEIGEGLGDQVSAALSTLGPDYREVVELADIGGEPYKTIAAKLGVPIGTVMSRLFRARRQLESLLAEYAAIEFGIVRAA